MPGSGESGGNQVRAYRQILLWPLQLMPIREDSQIQRHWELLGPPGKTNPWSEVEDEFCADPRDFKERHYNEFISFLPHVQRFLYGEARRSGRGHRLGGSPMRVFRREDVQAVRVRTHANSEPRTLQIKHIDLYFFYDIDVVLLNVEVHAKDLPLHEAQDLLYRFGRAYPGSWDDDGQARNCMAEVEWLGEGGAVLSRSDVHNREKFLSFVGRNRAAAIADHWAFLLKPLVLDAGSDHGSIRFKQLEYYRMPVMGYLAVADTRALNRNDFVRMGLVTAPGTDDRLPFSEQYLADFEPKHCYDRYWNTPPLPGDTRYVCNGHALVVVGDANSALFLDDETGVQAQFRHQYFLMFLIAHMQRAALLMFSKRLADAVDRLQIQDPESVKEFKRTIRQNFEIFLRFNHRYWFHDLSDQVQLKALFQMCARHLGSDGLYADVKEEILDMSQYLDSDSLRRQSNTVLRLTVVTTFGLIGTLVTGFLGMNLLASADEPLWIRALFFIATLIPTGWLTLYTVVKSKRISDFLEALSDEQLTVGEKLGALADVWRRRRLLDDAVRERR